MLKKITSIMISLSMLASASAAFAVPDAADGESMGPAVEAVETETPADVETESEEETAETAEGTSVPEPTEASETAVPTEPTETEPEVSLMSDVTLMATSGTCGDNLTWTLDDSGTLTISGTGDMWDWETNSEPWYDYNADISSVIIKSGVTSIGSYAFCRCRALKSIIIPNTVTAIYGGAFCMCLSLEAITIPDSVTYMSWDIFYRCSSLKNVKLSQNVSKIGTHSFFGCTSLQYINIPKNITEIGNHAFDGCTALTNVYYMGDEEAWKSVSIGEYNDRLKNAIIHYTSILPEEYVYDVTVEVRDSETNKLIPYASLFVFFSQTDTKRHILSNGRITLENVKFPLYIIYASAAGYNTTNRLKNIAYPSNGKIVLLLEKKNSTVQVQGVKISLEKLQMDVGDTQEFRAVISPNNASNKSVTWSSSNSAVADITRNGILTAKSTGTTTITLTASNGKSARVKITVNASSNLPYTDYEYNFLNIAESFGYPERYKIPIERYLQAGYTKSFAKNLNELWTGNCFGMSVSSVLYYKDVLKEEKYDKNVHVPNDFNAPAGNAEYDIRFRNMIELLMVSQYNYKLRGGTFYKPLLSPNDIKAISQEIYNGNPVTVLLQGNSGGHAVVFCGYEKKGDDYHFNIYDCSGYVSGLNYNVATQEYEFEYEDSRITWKPAYYITVGDMISSYMDLRDQNISGAASLLSVEELNTYIFCSAKNITLTNSEGKVITIENCEFNSEIENVRLFMPENLTCDSNYLIIAPNDTYIITVEDDEDTSITVANDNMSVDIITKSSVPIIVSDDMHDISIAGENGTQYEVVYTTYDNIFDEITLSGIAAGEVNTSLTGPNVIVSGAHSIDANTTRSDSNAKVVTDMVSGKTVVVECVEKNDGNATVQIKTDTEVLTESVILPARKQLSDLEYDLPSGEYTERQTLSFVKDNDTIIYYTTDGSDPSADNGIIYSEPLTIDKTITIKAIGTKYGYNDSNIVSLEYSLPDITIPVPSLLSGEYEGGQQVELMADEGSEIYYTTDGSDPLKYGELYEFPIVLYEDTIVRAYAVQNGCVSDTVDYTYTITTVDLPEETPNTTPYIIDSIEENGGKITVNVTGNIETNAKLIVSSFTSDGLLIGFNFMDISGAKTVELSLNTHNADYISAFIWNDFFNMMPVSNKLVKKL